MSMTPFAILVLVLALLSCLPFAVAALLALSSEMRAEDALRRTVRRDGVLRYARPGLGHRYSRFPNRIDRTPPPPRKTPQLTAEPATPRVTDPPSGHATAA